jgi:DNA polymerase-1
MAETAPKKLAIIDGKSVFYRGYYAMPNLSTKDGTPTGGVFGFASMALEVIRRLKPDYVAVAWDKPKTNIRRRLELYPEYKAGRKPAPPDFYEQIPVLHELLQAFGWPLYEMDDYEADDIMGTLAVQAREKGLETLLITSDLDMLQLVNGTVKVYALKTGFSNIELYSPQTFEAKYGIAVEQFLDYKSLVGDSSDNIPGVAGVGPVAARKLLNEYKTLDGVYENIDLISGKTRKQLVEHKDMAYLSRQLAEIWTNAPLDLDLSEVDGSKCQPEKLLHLLEKLEFKSLARQLPEVMQVAVENHQVATGTASLRPGKNLIIDSDQKLAEVKVLGSKQLYIHSRAAGKHGRDPQVLILSADGKTTYTFDLNKVSVDTLVQNFVGVRSLIGYDIKSTLQVLLEMGVKDLPPVGHDVLIGSFLINSLRREQTLTELAAADIGYDGSPFEDLDTDELMSRAPEFIAGIKALYELQVKELEDMPKLPKLAATIEWPVIPVLARMEHQGIQLNVEYLKAFSGEIEDTITLLEHEIYAHAGKEFNIGSPAQLGEILFVTLGLSTAGVKKGKTGYSTAVDTLDKLGDDDMVAQFNRGADIHVTTAAQIYGRQMEDVTKQQRSAAKTVNFGVLYGMSPHGLSVATGMSIVQAKHFIEEYFKLRGPLIGYLDGLKEQARKVGYVETLFGRRRPMPDIQSSNFMVRSAAERAAMNMPIQGTEADLMKLAMVAVDKELAKHVPTARQLLQIHDSILVECDEADAETVASILKKTMENIDTALSVKLLVDTSIGQNWGEL